MKIFSPSYKRAGKTSIQELLPTEAFSFVVPESQEAAYRQYSDNVLTIPDEEDGNVARKRNAILRHYAQDGEMVWMVDDDTFKFLHMKQSRKLSGEELWELMETTWICAQDAGSLMCGYSTYVHPLYYMESKPLHFVKPVYQFFGICKTPGLWYDESGVSDDTDMCLQVLIKRRGTIYRDNRFKAFARYVSGEGRGGIGKNMGGRRQETELLISKWGEQWIKTDKDGLAVIHRLPLKGV